MREWESEDWWTLERRMMSGSELARHTGLFVARTWREKKGDARLDFPHLEWDTFPKSGNHPIDKPISEQVEEDTKLLLLQRDFNELKRKYQAALTEGEMEKRIIGQMLDVLPRLKPVKPKTFTPSKDQTEETAVLLLSDWHIGERVSLEETGGLGEYDFEIYQERLNYLINKVKDLLLSKLQGYDIRNLVIPMLGDMVSGVIHEELVESSDITIDEAVVSGAYIMAQAIRSLAQEFETITVPCVVGNHGRLTKSVRYKHRHANWDRIFYKFVEAYLADQTNVAFNIPKSFWMVEEINGHNFLILHGDSIKCFTPETRVTMSDFTSKAIADIKAGDYVITHNGTRQRVNDTFTYDYEGDVSYVEAAYLPKSVWTAKPHHKILAVPQQKASYSLEPEWIEAGHISKGDYLAIPKPNIVDMSLVNTTRFTSHTGNHPRQKDIPDVIPASKDLGLIIGQYLADGWTQGKNGSRKGDCHNNVVGIVYHEDEQKFWEETQAAWLNVFGDSMKLHDITRAKAKQLSAYSQKAAALIEGLAGRGSHNKQVHPDVLSWPVESLNALLIGYLRGDGHTKRHHSRANTFTHGVTASTVSINLAEQLFWIAIRCGYKPSLKVKTRSGKPYAVISFWGDDARILGPLTQRDYVSNDKDRTRHNEQMCKVTDDYIFVPVTRAERRSYIGKVHDISVEGTHTYTAGLTAVHNSWSGIPWYGIQRAVARLTQLLLMQDMTFDHVVLGHFHNSGVLDQISTQVILNGSAIGGNEFSIGALFASSNPKQLLFGVHPKIGKTWSYDIDLSHA